MKPIGRVILTDASTFLGGEDELVVEDPLRFVVEAGGGVQLHDLVVLHGQVVTRPLEVRNLKLIKKMCC